MSGLNLPPAEPPDDDVADVQELLQRARLCRGDADHTLGHLMDALRHQEGMTAPARMYLDLERVVAEHRLFLWGQVVGVLEQQARSLGIQP